MQNKDKIMKILFTFLVVVILLSIGYIYYNSYNAKNSQKMNLAIQSAVNKPKITIELSPEESKRTPTTTVTATIKKDGMKVAETKTLNGTPVTLYKQTEKYAYFRLGYPTGIGGYDHKYFCCLARLDLKTNKLQEFKKSDYVDGTYVRTYVLDVSSNDMIVWGEESNHRIILDNVDKKTIDYINIPTKYDRIQEAVFSPDDKKIVYLVGENNDPFSPGNDVLFVFDINSKTQSKLLEDSLLKIGKWVDNGTVQVKKWKESMDEWQLLKLSI